MPGPIFWRQLKHCRRVATKRFGRRSWTDHSMRRKVAEKDGLLPVFPGVIISNLVTWVWTGSPYVVPAAMAKAAVHAMTMSLAVEWGPKGIRVNAVAPGPFPTENAWDKLNPLAETGVGATQAHEVPLRRFGEMDELRNLLIFLMSDGCSYITGDTISI